MSKKVFQVVKKLGVRYEDIVDICKSLKIKVKGVNTTLTDAQVRSLTKAIESQKAIA